MACAILGVRRIRAKRRQTVGSGRDELEPATRTEEAGAEAGHEVSQPSYSKGIGGIEIKTSSVRRATDRVKIGRFPMRQTNFGHDRFLRR